MKKQRNYLWVIVLICCLFSISCGTWPDHAVAAGEGMMKGSADAYEKKENKVSPWTWLIGAGFWIVGKIAGGKSTKTPEPFPSRENEPALAKENPLHGQTTPTQTATLTNDDTNLTAATDFPSGPFPPVPESSALLPLTASSITQTNRQNIGNPQVNEIATADRKVLAESRDPRRGNKPNRSKTGRGSPSANSNAGSTSSRAQGADGSVSYTQPNQKPLTTRNSASANSNADNTPSRAQGANGSLSYTQQNQQTPRSNASVYSDTDNTSSRAQGAAGGSSSGSIPLQVQRSAVGGNSNIPPSVSQKSTIIPPSPSQPKVNLAPNTNTYGKAQRIREILYRCEQETGIRIQINNGEYDTRTVRRQAELMAAMSDKTLVDLYKDNAYTRDMRSVTLTGTARVDEFERIINKARSGGYDGHEYFVSRHLTGEAVDIAPSTSDVEKWLEKNGVSIKIEVNAGIKCWHLQLSQ